MALAGVHPAAFPGAPPRFGAAAGPEVVPGAPWFGGAAASLLPDPLASLCPAFLARSLLHICRQAVIFALSGHLKAQRPAPRPACQRTGKKNTLSL